MPWQDTLSHLAELAKPIGAAMGSGQDADSTWNNPTLKEVRDKLTGFLTSDGTIDKMIAASHELNEKHKELMAKDPLTPQEVQALGVLSATAYALSADALARAVTPYAIFMYTMQRLLPWINRALKLADTIQHEVGSRDLDSLDQKKPPLPTKAQLQELAKNLRAAASLLEQL